VSQSYDVRKLFFDQNKSFSYNNGGGKGSRTPDLLNAIQALYQLSYTPKTDGASKRTRTVDLLITNQLLYQLSYAG
jgi:hypothetical protein